MKKIILTFLLAPITLLGFGDEFESGHYFVEHMTLIDYCSIPVTDNDDYFILWDNLVAVVKFFENDQQFLVPITLPGEEKKGRKFKQFLRLVYSHSPFYIKAYPGLTGPVAEIAETPFGIWDSTDASFAMRGGQIRSETQFYQN